MILRNVESIIKNFLNAARISFSDNIIIVRTGTKRLGQTFHVRQQLKIWKRHNIFSVQMTDQNLTKLAV